MRVLALDFDGVISNSAAEAFVVATRTYREMCPASEFGLETLEGRSRSSVEADPLYRAFVDLMPLGNRAEDFGVVLAAFEQKAELLSQKDYDAFRSAQDPEFLEAFHQRFYEVRSAWASRDLQGWRALMRPYSSFLEILDRRSSEVRMAITTAKDRASVRSLLKEYGAEGLFPESSVLDKETGVSKCTHLELLRDLLGCDFEEIVFIDDKVNHLREVSRLGVRCGLATWGYNGPREAEEARRSGFLLLTLGDVERQIFPPASKP